MKINCLNSSCFRKKGIDLIEKLTKTSKIEHFGGFFIYSSYQLYIYISIFSIFSIIQNSICFDKKIELYDII